jgi:hypothetical protein
MIRLRNCSSGVTMQNRSGAEKDRCRQPEGSASSPDPFFKHGGAESLSDITLGELTTEDTESTEDEVL